MKNPMGSTNGCSPGEIQRKMEINKDAMNFFNSLYWDYQVSEENIITIIELGECNGFTRKNLLSRASKSCRWYEIKKILSPELLKEALSEDVLKTLVPKSLSRKYNYVRKILYHNEEYPFKIEFVNDVFPF